MANRGSIPPPSTMEPQPEPCPHCGAKPLMIDGEWRWPCDWAPWMDDPDEWGEPLPRRE